MNGRVGKIKRRASSRGSSALPPASCPRPYTLARETAMGFFLSTTRSVLPARGGVGAAARGLFLSAMRAVLSAPVAPARGGGAA